MFTLFLNCVLKQLHNNNNKFIIKIIRCYIGPVVNLNITLSGTMKYNVFANVTQDEKYIICILTKNV